MPLQNTTKQPLLTSLSDRAVREKLFNLSWTRTEKGDKNDTRAIIAQLAMIRAEKAKLLGYDTHAQVSLGVIRCAVCHALYGMQYALSESCTHLRSIHSLECRTCYDPVN